MKATCVMPTTESRKKFWSGAVDCFKRQTWAEIKLLVLNETNDIENTPSVFNNLMWISYQALPVAGKITTGTKRNLVNALVDADVIIHWDDDDWSAPDRVERQLRLLESSGKPVVGVHDLLYHRTTDRTLWRYDFQGTPPYACGTSLCYLRSYWEAHRFPDKRHSEDTDFAMKARAEGNLASEPNAGMIVARWHGHNTYDPRFGPKPFTRERREKFPAAFLAQEGL